MNYTAVQSMRKQAADKPQFDPTQVAPLRQDTINRMRWVESSGGKNTYNKKTQATGPQQITPIAQKELKRIHPGKFDSWQLKDMNDELKSQTLMHNLMKKWGIDYQKKYKVPITEEILCKMWHAGRRWNGTQANEYWNRMMSPSTTKAISSTQAGRQ